VSVIEPSYAIKRGNGQQTAGRRLALRTSLRPQLELWLGLAQGPAILHTFLSSFVVSLFADCKKLTLSNKITPKLRIRFFFSIQC